MKWFVALCVLAMGCMTVVGPASAQDYYGGMYPAQGGTYGYGQDYGQGAAAAAYGYGQGMPGAQYGYSQPGYGQGYGQQAATPYQQQQGYPGAGGYPDYSAYGYDQSGYYYGSGLPYQQGTGAYAQPGGTTAPQGRAARGARSRPVVEQPRTAPGPGFPSPSRSAAREPDALTSSEIYWDGRTGEEDYSASEEVSRPGAPAPRAVSRPSAPSSGASQAIQQPNSRQQRRNVVRQAAPAPPTGTASSSGATTAPPPPRTMKWGKQDEQEKPETRRPMQWGRQDKPAMVGSEPGVASQGPGRDSSTSAGTALQAESQGSGKRFQWGQNQ